MKMKYLVALPLIFGIATLGVACTADTDVDEGIGDEEVLEEEGIGEEEGVLEEEGVGEEEMGEEVE